MVRYHDREWGRPVRRDREHFERLSLEVFQAGLSWRTILHKRDAFRAAFAGFVPKKVARFTRRDVARLLRDAGIVRHRGKIEATIENARRFLDTVSRHGRFDRYLDAAGPKAPELMAALRRDFRFMGPLTAEAYLQAVGRARVPHDRGCAARAAAAR